MWQQKESWIISQGCEVHTTSISKSGECSNSDSAIFDLDLTYLLTMVTPRRKQMTLAATAATAITPWVRS